MNDLDIDLGGMGASKLRKELKRVRNGIRQHRDAKGHDRCWENDWDMYKLLPESKDADFTLPPEEEFLENCKRYFHEQTGDQK